jgi:thioredoxin reductase
MSGSIHSDVIIIGGSYAGLSAAMSLGRSLRKVLIIDGGLPCNRQAPHSHNFLTRDGEQPAVVAAIGRQQVLEYHTVQFVEDLAIKAEKTARGFNVHTRSGNTYQSKKIVFATGIKDTMPGIKGFAECWGISVVHCPYCHGYEIRNRKTLLIANSEHVGHMVPIIRNLTKDLTIVSSGTSPFTPEQSARFAMHGIEVLEAGIDGIEHDNGFVRNVLFSDGSRRMFESIYAPLPFTQHTDIPVTLGCELTEHGYLKIDPFQKTNIDGVYACGDNSAMMRSIANAVHSGNLAGAIINRELAEEEW